MVLVLAEGEFSGVIHKLYFLPPSQARRRGSLIVPCLRVWHLLDLVRLQVHTNIEPFSCPEYRTKHGRDVL